MFKYFYGYPEMLKNWQKRAHAANKGEKRLVPKI